MKTKAADEAQDIISNMEKRRALAGILKGSLLAAGLGMGVRATKGMWDIFRKDRTNAKLRKAVTGMQPSMIRVPYPVYEEDPLLEAPVPSGGKDKSLLSLERNLNKTAEKDPTVPPIVGKEPGSPSRGFGGYVLGDNATNRWNMPWYPPTGLAGILGGTYLGYKLTDVVADKLKKKERERDVSDAKEEYRKALLQPYLERMAKTSADNEMAELAKEYISKEGGFGQTLQNIGGTATGAYLALAGLLAGGLGLASYKYFGDKSPQKLVASKLKNDMLAQWAARPPNVTAIPVPIRMQRKKDKQLAQATDEELAEIQKSASLLIEKYASALNT